MTWDGIRWYGGAYNYHQGNLGGKAALAVRGPWSEDRERGYSFVRCENWICTFGLCAKYVRSFGSAVDI